MKSLGELMKEMGFNKDAPIETQKAFFRHLINAANGAQFNRKPPDQRRASEQLSFNLTYEQPSGQNATGDSLPENPDVSGKRVG